MGALLSGLMGAAGADIEKQSDRAYQEKRQERADRMNLLTLAASNPNTKPDMLPKIFSELDDLAKDAGYKTKNKNQFAQMGGMVQKILHRRNQQQQQQAGQQQARTDVAGAPGVTAQPGQGPQGGAPGQMTQPMPDRNGFGGFFKTQADITGEKEQEFQTGLKHQGQESQASFDQKLKEVDQLVKQGYDKQSAQQIVFGKTATPAAGKFAPFYVSGKNIPPDVNVDALGNQIDRSEAAQYKMEEGNPPKFYPASAAPKAGGGADELAKMSKIILAKQGIQKPTEAQAAAAVQQAGKVLFQNKVLNPQERIQLTRDAVRTIVGETGLLTVPTHQHGAGAGGMTPPLPPSRVPGGANAPPAPAPNGGPRATPFPAGFTPEVKGAERTRKVNSEVIMTRGGSAIATIGNIAQQHPNWVGLGGSTWQDILKKVGAADPQVGQLKGAMDSLIGFLPSLHSFRSKSILDEWKRTLDNPLKNPPLTQSVIREVMKAAQEVRDSILKRSTAPMTAEDEEKKAAEGAGGGGPSPAALEYMKKKGIQ